ncbi:MAG: hypothetical protein HBSIN02_18610 [Bacteroidia bacterium]|nr:MAG: hypothetical protein HBSIN02_18610 [Bacteroidia bacterium]
METRHTVFWAAGIALLGAVTSGPLSLWLVSVTHPQPAWTDVTSYATAYHWIQTVPFFFGFLLVGGFVALIAALYAQAPVRGPRETTAVVLSAVFGAMIVLNYAIQTTFVPALMRQAGATELQLAAAFTMANPSSLGWAFEMWGYAVLGVATWLIAPALNGPSRLLQTARVLFVINAPVSVLPALATALWTGWVTSPIGLAAFAAWNVLVVAMLILVMGAMRAPRGATSSAGRWAALT